MTQGRTFDEIEARLNVITDAVSNEGTSLDEALALFEEAVKLGLEACEITDAEIVLPEEDAVEAEVAAVASDGADDQAEAPVTGGIEAAETVEVAEGEVFLA